MSKYESQINKRRQETLDVLDSTSTSSPEKRRRGRALVAGAVAVMSVGVFAHEPISNGVTIVGNKIVGVGNGIDEFLDDHNNPPDGVVIVDGSLPGGVPTAQNDLSSQQGALPQNQEIQP